MRRIWLVYLCACLHVRLTTAVMAPKGQVLLQSAGVSPPPRPRLLFKTQIILERVATKPPTDPWGLWLAMTDCKEESDWLWQKGPSSHFGDPDWRGGGGGGGGLDSEWQTNTSLQTHVETTWVRSFTVVDGEIFPHKLLNVYYLITIYYVPQVKLFIQILHLVIVFYPMWKDRGKCYCFSKKNSSTNRMGLSGEWDPL